MMCRFSIVIPAFNYGRYLSEAIESALAQEGEDFEVIVIDDGSTDNTRDVIQPYLDRVRFFDQPNRGLSAVRNRGARISKGLYLLFLDADDRLLPGALQAFREFLAKFPDTDLAFCGYVSVTEDGTRRVRRGKRLPSNREAAFRAFINRRIAIANGASILHRRVFSKVQFPESLRSSVDEVFYGHVLALLRCRSFADAVLEVRAHEGRMRDDFVAIRQAGTRVVDLLFDERILPPALMELRHEFLSTHLLQLFRAYYVAGRHQEANALYREAIRARPANVLRWRYARKFARSLWNRVWRKSGEDRAAAASPWRIDSPTAHPGSKNGSACVGSRRRDLETAAFAQHEHEHSDR